MSSYSSNDSYEYKENPNNPVYDMVIDIQSLTKLKEGWKVKYCGSEENQKRVKNISKQKHIRISVIGNANRGKTFILQKISNLNFDGAIGHTVSTQGLSIKFPKDKQYVLLDTLGNNAPILIDDINDDPRDRDDYEENVKNEIKDRLIANYIIQNFIIQKADIIICVVGQLTTSEQQFLNKIKNICKNNTDLYVIHNLINLDKKLIPNYIEKTLKKNVIFKLKDRIIPGFNENKEENFGKYYVDEDESEEKKEDIANTHKILHFILGKEEKGKNDIKYYNDSAISFIKSKINDSIKKNHDNILEELKDFLINISDKILETPIKKEDLKIEDDKLIYKNNENINVRNIREDELNNIIFISNDKIYIPPYRYYRKDSLLVIEIFLNGIYEIETNYKIKKNDVAFEIKGYLKKKNQNTRFKSITKTKYGDNLINQQSFNIKFHIDTNEFNIKSLQLDEMKGRNKGIIKFNYKIIDKFH